MISGEPPGDDPTASSTGLEGFQSCAVAGKTAMSNEAVAPQIIRFMLVFSSSVIVSKPMTIDFVARHPICAGFLCHDCSTVDAQSCAAMLREGCDEIGVDDHDRLPPR